MRLTLLALAVLTMSCVSLKERLRPGVLNPQRYEAPADFERWYHEVEGCLGKKGNYSKLAFFVADSISDNGPERLILGYWYWEDIYWRRDYLLERLGGVVLERLVKHEFVHDVLHESHGPWYEHQPRHFDACSQTRT